MQTLQLLYVAVFVGPEHCGGFRPAFRAVYNGSRIAERKARRW